MQVLHGIAMTAATGEGSGPRDRRLPRSFGWARNMGTVSSIRRHAFSVSDLKAAWRAALMRRSGVAAADASLSGGSARSMVRSVGSCGTAGGFGQAIIGMFVLGS